MNLETFEKNSHAHSSSQAEVSFAESEAERLKQKIYKRRSRQKRLKTIFSVLAVLVFFFAALTAYSQYKLYVLRHDEQMEGTDAPLAKTGEEVIRALSRHILVPNGTPQIAEVKDVEKLRQSQAFFKDAENGDIVIVYETSILLYRPSKDVIVGWGDISGIGQKNP